MSASARFIIWVASMLFAALIWCYIVSLIPAAMKQESVNQNNIAPSNWKHKPGLYEYKKFMEDNNGY